MKAKKIIFLILMFLPLLMVVVSLQFLPNQIPAHFGADGQVDRWGSKYETFIFPISTIVMGLIMLVVAKISSKQEGSGENNEKICIISGIVSLFIFNAMTVYFLYIDFTSTEKLFNAPIDINSILFAIIGISMIILGNFMPKLKKNSLIGLRTTKTLKSEVVWKKSQRFGGIALIIGGIGVILTSVLTKAALCMWISMGIILAVALICLVYTFLVKE